VSITTFHSDLEKLIRKFEADQQHYFSKNYLEAQARMDLITPFFKALGWDVENEAGTSVFWGVCDPGGIFAS
jgi:hypothetical protein